MRWLKAKPGGVQSSWTHDKLFFHDLVDDEDNQLAWVREDRRSDPPIFMGLLTDYQSNKVFPATRSLAEAKAQVIHYLVTQRMNDQ